MIKPLRKRHLQIWTVLSVLLPLGIVFSWLVIPNPVPVKMIDRPNPEILPLIIYKKDIDAYCINIRTNKENTAWQLEWKNKLPLTVPTAVIYRTSGHNRDIKNGQLIGRIEARGNYVFALPADPLINGQTDFILYDFIHHKVIETFNLKTTRPLAGAAAL